MKKSVLIIFILLLAARSCYYVDDSRHWVEIEDYEPVVTFTSNFDTIDNIRIVDSLLFKYEINIDSGALYLADLYLNNMQLFRSDTVVDSLWIYPQYINDAETYYIHIVAYCRKFTGSLADILDADFLIADTSWTVRFFKDLE